MVDIIISEKDVQKLEELSKEKEKYFQNNLIQFFKWPINLLNPLNKNPKETEKIEYEIKYEELLRNDYSRNLGEDGLIYKREDVISKQRAVSTYLIKKIGSNLLKGKSIMNISLPINIFDFRSLLEQWVWQNGMSSIILEKTENLSTLEKLKYSTIFAMSKFYLLGAPLKPFNPILGETFQAKLNNSHYYLEQTSHHPPIMNFYAYGKNYKIYGFEESDASTYVNTLTIYYKGNFIIEYPDGTKNIVIYPTLNLSGTMMGIRKMHFKGKLVVYDIKNDLCSFINLDPSPNDSRGLISKFFKSNEKKMSFPDYFIGGIYKLSDFKLGKYDNSIIDKINVTEKIKRISKIEGHFTIDINFDDKCYWNFYETKYPDFFRDNFTLPSDSAYRLDEILFKIHDEEFCQQYKILMEEDQRYDRKLREEYNSKNSNSKKKKK